MTYTATAYTREAHLDELGAGIYPSWVQHIPPEPHHDELGAAYTPRALP